MSLSGSIVKVPSLSAGDRADMFGLMDAFYMNMGREAFERDLMEKDYALLLRDAGGVLRGFTTQRLMELLAGGETVRGVFSGDTIIHRDYWGDLALFTTFARFYFPLGERYREFYWFLICKGYKTYRMLPLFFRSFYPRRDGETPRREREIMHAYAAALYPGEYDPGAGVVRYRRQKDYLRPGVADITGRERKNLDVAFFEGANPRWAAGEDLVCLASLKAENLRPRMKKLLLGGAPDGT